MNFQSAKLRKPMKDKGVRMWMVFVWSFFLIEKSIGYICGLLAVAEQRLAGSASRLKNI